MSERTRGQLVGFGRCWCGETVLLPRSTLPVTCDCGRRYSCDWDASALAERILRLEQRLDDLPDTEDEDG